MSIKDTVEAIQLATKEIEQYRRDALNVVHLRAMDALNAYVNETGKPLFILVRGYTPYFNDGEPCEHTQDVLFDSEIYDYSYDDEDDDEVTSEFMDDNWNISTKQLVAMIEQQKVDYTYNELIAVVNVFEVLQDAIAVKSRDGSNFHMVYWFKPGHNYIRYETEYHCGF